MGRVNNQSNDGWNASKMKVKSHEIEESQSPEQNK